MHPQLEAVVRRHLAHPDQSPIAEHTRSVFRSVERLLDGRPVILDSGCGTGLSTQLLAQQHSGAWVIGIDKSLHRLSRGGHGTLTQEGNAVWVRAELAHFWRLAVAAGWRLQAHYLLYPNPWPKPGHLMRRWHGHPAFAAMLALGGHFESRSNVPDYLAELAQALALAGIQSQRAPVVPDPPLTLFEKKYHARGEPLLRLTAQVDTPKPTA